MYTFVFLWTPALSPRGEKIPHGTRGPGGSGACARGRPGCAPDVWLGQLVSRLYRAPCISPPPAQPARPPSTLPAPLPLTTHPQA